MATALRKEVLGLYRACMRSARKCPEWEQREMMKTYVRMKFKDEKLTRDTSRIKRMMADACEELEQMEYYHTVYEEKQRQSVMALEAVSKASAAQATGSNSPVQNVEEQTPGSARCSGCHSEYVPPQAKFCSNCGLKRP